MAAQKLEVNQGQLGVPSLLRNQLSHQKTTYMSEHEGVKLPIATVWLREPGEKRLVKE